MSFKDMQYGPGHMRMITGGTSQNVPYKRSYKSKN